MKDQRKTEIKVGITAIVGTLLFLWILGWAKNFSFTSNEKILTVQFSNVAGLEIGDYVMVNGVREGHVADIKAGDNDVLVKLALNNEVTLKKDATFAISMLDLMGGKKVDISPGTSAESLNYDKIQKGIYYADIPKVMSLVGSMQGDLIASMKDIRVTLTSLNKYLTDQKLNTDIKSSVENLNVILKKLNLMIDENHSNIKKLAENSVELTDQAKQFIDKNKSDMSSSIKELSKVLLVTDTLLTKVKSFGKETQNKQNNLGKILYDKNLSENLVQTVNRLNKITKLLLNQLQEKGIKVDAHIKLF